MQCREGGVSIRRQQIEEGRGVRCFKCGGEGHRCRECPKRIEEKVK